MVLTYPPPTISLETEKVYTPDLRRLHFFDRGVGIPLKEEGVWQVYRGVVQLSESLVNGDEILLGWLQVSGFLGLGLTPLQMETYQAKALSDVYLRWYSLKEIQEHPKLTDLVLQQTLQRLRQTERLLAIAGLKRVDERLIALFRLLAQEMGEPMAEGIRLSVRLTHQALANAIGTTRVTVTRLIGDLQAQQVIHFDGDRHLVLHTQRFKG
jgi:CRP-like cAMP-binding protein